MTHPLPPTRPKRFKQAMQAVAPKAIWAASLALAGHQIKNILFGSSAGYLGKNYYSPSSLSLRSVATGRTVDIALLDVAHHPTGSINPVQDFASPEELMSSLTNLIQSDYTKRLLQVFGAPSQILAEDAGADTGGVYSPETDTVTLSTRPGGIQNSSEAKSFLIHELAHVWQARQGDILGEIWTKYKIPPPPEARASYASSQRAEHQAARDRCRCRPPGLNFYVVQF